MSLPQAARVEQEDGGFCDDTDEWMWFQLNVVEIESRNAEADRAKKGSQKFKELQKQIRDPENNGKGKEYWGVTETEQDALLPFCR